MIESRDLEHIEEPDHRDRDLRDLREAAVEVVRQLTQAGHAAYFAGGCVRDRLLNIAPADYDIATSARPEQVRAIFRRANEVGLAFGVMLVRVRQHEVQVATFRTDGVYSDSRHPDSVTFSDAEHDARRRDFTINGLFENPLNDRIIDYVGGQADLEARLLRAIGDPFARLREDRLRMLRAVRFASRFGFAIDPETADAIRAEAGELKGVSRERIGHEVRRMLSDPNRAVAAWEMQYLGLDEPTLQEPNRLTAPTRVGRLPDHAPYATALSGWLLDRHEVEGGDLLATANRWADALVLSNDERGAMHATLAVYATLQSAAWMRLGVASQKRLAVSPHFDSGIILLQATDRQAYVDVRTHVLRLAESGLAPDALITGGDLIDLGLSPGPLFSRVLTGVYDAQLEGTISTRDEAIRLAKAIAAAENGQD